MLKHRAPKKAAFDPRTVKENIVDTPLNEEMSKSFLEYAYSVIYARALPDARDGLKPVQRRIVYQMGQMNLLPERPYMKSARVVGEVMGKLHPHGDSAIYEAMVRLAQPFAMRLPLVDGHGNFGSLDDGPAASRYTEARMASSALGMNADIDEDTVSFSPNYDNKLKEPDVLPSAIPNLLVNGASGIAVGMATNMITHNLGEVIAAAKYMLHHPDASLDDLMRFVPGPDLPGGGIIMGREGIREAYETGRGRFVTRAKIHLENITARKKGIVVTELPFMVGPEKVLERISDAVRSKKLDGITGAVDLSDRHNGMKIIIEIKSGFNPEAVLAQLYKHTPLQDAYTINNVALVDGRPHTMGLKELLRVWIDHRRSVIKARSEFRRKKALERLHLVEGLLLALIDIDEVIEVIRSSDDVETAKNRLMVVFDLDEIQATYILDLRLRRLTKMSRVELESERDDLRRKIAELEEILSSQDHLDAVVVEEMDNVVAKWNTPRRTLLLDHDGTVLQAEPDPTAPVSDSSAPANAGGGAGPSIGVGAGIGTGIDATSAGATPGLSLPTGVSGGSSVAGVIGVTGTGAAGASLELEDSPCTVMLTTRGLIARSTPSALDLFEARDASVERATDDEIRSLFATTTRAEYGIITSAGRLVKANVSDLPLIAASESLSVSGGVHADDLLRGTESTQAVPGERVVAAIALDSTTPLALGTRGGIVKRWNMDSPTTMDSWSVISLKDDNGTVDEVLTAAPADDSDRIVFITSDASLLTFEASSVRPQGRSSAGMTGIKLNDDQRVLAFAVIPAGKIAWSAPEPDEDGTVTGEPSGAVVLTVAGDSKALPGTEEGFAKLTPFELYPTKGRSTRGVRAQRFLKGQDTLICAAVGPYPLRASSESGRPVGLPDIDMRRDGSGQELEARIDTVE
ncbi:MAG: DNA topoisomerase IV subunit A [Bifidobacteriaceae bacterium]|jgi:DNA gyrase subunit A|nr:DNA topoisomerase IV subunit A [Bifidobacteriaceae bacterium]MCI1914261.1 DNA topoisomerase IV subunit A [Bifidobacteriaceae bacterium]